MDLCSNKYVLTVGSLFLILYSSYVAPELPESMRNFLRTPLMMIVCLSLFAYFFTNDIRVSIVLSLVFIIMTHGIEGLSLENLPNCRFTCVKDTCSSNKKQNKQKPIQEQELVQEEGKRDNDKLNLRGKVRVDAEGKLKSVSVNDEKIDVDGILNALKNL